MKRSDAVIIIKDYLIDFDKDQSDKEYEFDASFLLGLLEEKGMMPPHTNSTYLMDETPEWEPETDIVSEINKTWRQG